MKKRVTVCDNCGAEFDDYYAQKGGYSFSAMRGVSFRIYKTLGRDKKGVAKTDVSLQNVTEDTFFCSKKCFMEAVK